MEHAVTACSCDSHQTDTAGIVYRSYNATCPAILLHKSEIKVRSLQRTGRSVDAQATTMCDRRRRSVILFRGLQRPIKMREIIKFQVNKDYQSVRLRQLYCIILKIHESHSSIHRFLRDPWIPAQSMAPQIAQHDPWIAQIHRLRTIYSFNISTSIHVKIVHIDANYCLLEHLYQQVGPKAYNYPLFGFIRQRNQPIIAQTDRL